MRTTILMAGLVAGLAGVAALAQTTETPEAGTPEAGATAPAQAQTEQTPAQTPPAEPVVPPPEAPDMDDMGAMMDHMAEMMGQMGGMGGMHGMGGMDGHGPMGGVPNMAPLALEIYDTDGDGIITQAEIEARKAARFAAADADGNGGLSPEELVALEEAVREEVRVARAGTQIERFDDNADGLLQAEEIEARTPRLAPVFDRLDTDGDGGISEEELNAMREGRGEGPMGGFFRRFMDEHGMEGRGMGRHGRHGD